MCEQSHFVSFSIRVVVNIVNNFNFSLSIHCLSYKYHIVNIIDSLTKYFITLVLDCFQSKNQRKKSSS